jgi:hypothetical protein
VRQEIEERHQFLIEMTELGKGKEYRPIILAEISKVSVSIMFYSLAQVFKSGLF